MSIASLRVNNFRNLSEVELEPCQMGLNLICGNNGCGKTSLLEAIYYLSQGRSFRSSNAVRLIRHQSEKFSLFSQILSDYDLQIPIGMERDVAGSTRLRIAEKEASSITELANHLPLRLINSQSHNLFESGPIFRRKLLDWGLYYLTDSFFGIWRQFERVLKQRNVLLRERRPRNELDAWTDELIRYGVELDALRRDYVTKLAPIVGDLAHKLLDLTDLEFNYLPGWNAELSYADAMMGHFMEEIRAGHTLYGPHRADLDITKDGLSVKHFLSRGQQKLLICAIIIAQGKLLAAHANRNIIYLVDDLPAELDSQSRQKLINLLSDQQTQVFITAIDSNTISDFVVNRPEVPVKVFHVKHGTVSEGSES